MKSHSKIRRWVLIGALLIAAILWTEFSVWSPVDGWFEAGMDAWRVARIREAAIPPCTSAEWTAAGLALELDIQYPACYEFAASKAKDLALLMDSVSSAMPFVVRVGSLRPEILQSGIDPLKGWRPHDLQDTRSRNGWNVYSYRGGYWSTGWDYTSYEYVLLGHSRAVVVRGDLPDILEASEVERVVVATLESLADRICSANNGDLVVSAETEALDADRLRFWITELNILQFQLQAVMQSEGAT